MFGWHWLGRILHTKADCVWQKKPWLRPWILAHYVRWGGSAEVVVRSYKHHLAPKCSSLFMEMTTSFRLLCCWMFLHSAIASKSLRRFCGAPSPGANAIGGGLVPHGQCARGRGGESGERLHAAGRGSLLAHWTAFAKESERNPWNILKSYFTQCLSFFFFRWPRHKSLVKIWQWADTLWTCQVSAGHQDKWLILIVTLILAAGATRILETGSKLFQTLPRWTHKTN